MIDEARNAFFFPPGNRQVSSSTVVDLHRPSSFANASRRKISPRNNDFKIAVKIFSRFDVKSRSIPCKSQRGSTLQLFSDSIDGRNSIVFTVFSASIVSRALAVAQLQSLRRLYRRRRYTCAEAAINDPETIQSDSMLGSHALSRPIISESPSRGSARRDRDENY